MDPERIGIIISDLIGDRNRKTVAEDLDISLSALNMYIRGERIPRDEIKLKIAKYFGKTVDEIFFNNQMHELCT